MKKQQKIAFDDLAILLNDITLVAEKVDYLSYQCLDISKNITAYDAYKMMTFCQPKWLKNLFIIRDFLGKMVGIKPIQGFYALKENDVAVGNQVHFFTVAEKETNKLTLMVKDSHLDVCIHIRIVDNTEYQNKLYLITSVKNHNFIGQLYMIPVSPAHPYIVNKLFENIIC